MDAFGHLHILKEGVTIYKHPLKFRLSHVQFLPCRAQKFHNVIMMVKFPPENSICERIDYLGTIETRSRMYPLN